MCVRMCVSHVLILISNLDMIARFLINSHFLKSGVGDSQAGSEKVRHMKYMDDDGARRG